MQGPREANTGNGEGEDEKEMQEGGAETRSAQHTHARTHTRTHTHSDPQPAIHPSLCMWGLTTEAPPGARPCLSFTFSLSLGFLPLKQGQQSSSDPQNCP